MIQKSQLRWTEQHVPTATLADRAVGALTRLYIPPVASEMAPLLLLWPV